MYVLLKENEKLTGCKFLGGAERGAGAGGAGGGRGSREGCAKTEAEGERAAAEAGAGAAEEDNTKGAETKGRLGGEGREKITDWA